MSYVITSNDKVDGPHSPDGIQFMAIRGMAMDELQTCLGVDLCKTALFSKVHLEGHRWVVVQYPGAT